MDLAAPSWLACGRAVQRACLYSVATTSLGHDVRVAVAEMLSALCYTPHTRAAVVDAKCIGYLGALLYEHHSHESEEMVHYAGSALLQLAAGALTRVNAMTGDAMAAELSVVK